MSRRALTPAARGVSLAVLAALRAGRVDLADQADGSTLATSTAPDGTVLLHAVVRMPVRGHDPRQLTLPAVAPVPVPAEVPPAPVAVPAGEERDAEAPAPQGEPVRCWIAQRQWDEAHRRDADAEGWLVEPVAGTVLDWTDAAPWETVLVPAGPVLNELRKVCARVGVTLHESDAKPPMPAPAGDEPDPPEPNVSVLDASHGLAVGDIATLDDEDIRVTVSDEFGWQGETVATARSGRPLANVHCDWDDVERVGDRAWYTRPPREKLRTAVDEGAPVSKGAKKAAKKAAKPKAPKAAPRAGLVPEDEDALWEIVLEDWPARCRELDMLDAETVILWTHAPGDHIRTVVPGKHIPTIRTRAIDGGATVLREEPSGDPCHLAVIGGEVETNEGPMGLLGVCDDVVNALIGLVLEGARTVDGGKPFVAWADEVKVIDGRVVVTLSKWWTAVRNGETWRAERLPEARKALAPAKPKRAAKAPKARPARLTPEPEADALTRHGQRCVVAVIHEGGPWELVWCDEMPGQMTHDVAWASVEEQAHRARRYDRGGHCAADTRDALRLRAEEGDE